MRWAFVEGQVSLSHPKPRKIDPEHMRLLNLGNRESWKDFQTAFAKSGNLNSKRRLQFFASLLTELRRDAPSAQSQLCMALAGVAHGDALAGVGTRGVG